MKRTDVIFLYNSFQPVPIHMVLEPILLDVQGSTLGWYNVIMYNAYSMNEIEFGVVDQINIIFL